MGVLAVVLAALAACAAAGPLEAYAAAWATPGDASRCGGGDDCAWMAGFGAIDAGCTFDVASVGLAAAGAAPRGPALRFALANGSAFFAAPASGGGRFRSRPAVASADKPACLASKPARDATPAPPRALLESFYDGVRHGGARRAEDVTWVSNHYIKVPRPRQATTDRRRAYYVDLDAVHGSRFYARDAPFGRNFFAAWFANRCSFKDQYALWHTAMRDACPHFRYCDDGGDRHSEQPIVDEIFHHSIDARDPLTFAFRGPRATRPSTSASSTSRSSPLCAAGAPLRNVAHDFHSGSSGTDAGGNRGLPPLVIAKRGGFRQKGILIPNPYYGSLARDWNATRAAILARGRATPWASRRAQAFWRGRIISHDASNNLSDALKCEYEYGNHARLAAVALSFRRPDAVDVKCTTAAATDCRPRDAVARPCAALPYTADMARVAREPTLIAGDAPVDRADYSAYRYVLNLPGATTGSYSKNLNHLWALGAVVMLWDAPFVEWCPACLAAYFGAVVDRARARYGQAAVLDDAARCRDLAGAAALPGGPREFHLRNDKRCRANLDAADPAARRGPGAVAPDAPGLPAATP
ncbi:10-hydroxy-9-(phosphonooxy)octadecanoate phosphatase [Aureococcus anophagefferens]|nr:10-hydroxy-9-(phosphonooxy)octadecanoate phosphatase [Aureococcus anophagefferens]